MRSTAAPVKPSLPALRVVSDVLDEVEVDLESIQRDLVLAERAGAAVLVICALAVAGAVAFVVVRRVRQVRRRGALPAVPDGSWPPVPPASRTAATDGRAERPGA
jgi:hypothetical protein